jgi:glycosyltransferase involved in cell wall biosynthesis
MAADRERLGRRPRVLFAIGSLARGGSENQLLELISRTHGRDLDALLMTFSPCPDAGRERMLAGLGVTRMEVGPLGAPRALRPFVAVPRVTAHVRRARPDVVYAWLEAPATVLWPVARVWGIPLIVARRNVCGAREERLWPVREAVRMAERSARVVTANSEAVLEHAASRGVPRERLRLIRNGHFAAEALPPPISNPVVVGYVANYRPEKGHRRLLRALELVRARTPWRVDLAGRGALADALVQEARARGLGDRVRMVGEVTDPREFWRTRHVAALLSDHEGSPNALIEAAVCGRPLLATDVGGARELVTADAGLLVAASDPRRIARALERLIDDEPLRARLGAGARDHALREHSMERFVAGHVAAIEEVLSAR